MTLAEILQELQKSGEISDYIAAEVPGGALTTGWVQQRIIVESVRGDLRSKSNQDELVIPSDRFVRLHRDEKMADYREGAMLVFGHGRKKQVGLVSVIPPDSMNDDGSCVVVSMHSVDADLSNLISRMIGSNAAATDEEPNLDYLEQMKQDLVEERLHSLLNLRIPKREFKAKELIGTKNLVSEGDIEKLKPLALTLVRWLMGQKMFQSTKRPLVSVVLLGKRATLIFLWDGPNGIATFAIAGGQNLMKCITYYVQPLWPEQPNTSGREKGAPRVFVESSTTRHTSSSRQSEGERRSERHVGARDLVELSSRLDAIPISELEKKIEHLESAEKRTPRNRLRNELATTEMLKRFNDTLERLEQVTKRMKSLEERIGRVTKDME
jgi:hypothetical protein